MTCEEFLERYSEFSDGRIAETDADRFRAHTLICRGCARYDRVIREGCALLSGFPEIEPSYDFRPRLQHRIFHLQEELKHERSGAGTLATMGVAAFLLTAVWGAFLASEQATTPGTVPAAEDRSRAIAAAAEEDEAAAGAADALGFEQAAGAVWVDPRGAWWHEHEPSASLATVAPSGPSPVSTFWRVAPVGDTPLGWPPSRSWSASFFAASPGLDAPRSGTYSPLLTGPPAYQSRLRLITSRAARD